MRPKIFILAFILVFSFSAIACAQEARYAIIKVPTDPERIEKGEKVEISFEDENGNVIKTDPKNVDKWPLPVNKNVLFLDGAIWYISNPQVCVWWDKQRK